MSSSERINQIKQIIHDKYNEVSKFELIYFKLAAIELEKMFFFKIDIQSKIREIITEKFREIQEERNENGEQINRPQKLTHDMVLQEVKKKGFTTFYLIIIYTKYGILP